MEAPTNNRRLLAIALCVVSAACLVYAALGTTWLVNETDEYGLRTGRECSKLTELGGPASLHCSERTNAQVVELWRALDAKQASSAHVPTGWITFVLALLAAAALAASAALAAANKAPHLPIAPTTIAFLGVAIALITGCVFVATKPGPAGSVGVGPSFWIFGLGCVMGIAGAQLAAKVNQPRDDEWDVE